MDINKILLDLEIQGEVLKSTNLITDYKIETNE